ncbi:ABC transporter permease [Streptomyces sp. TG1A-60]|uniref:ABC transporter permease n=1 Tax=Streptomyces sp. TG1A-60 TaxID=3129111 RepID=UPI0030CDE5C6
MTTTATAPVSRRGLRPRGLTWAMFRLHTWAAVLWALLVLVAAGMLLWAAGPGGDAAWVTYHTEACREEQMNAGCDYTALDRYDTAVGLGSSLISLSPLVVAGWAGAALIGRELENGTARLAWTQSVTPARWLAAKLAVPAALLTTGTLLLVLLHRLMWSSHIGQWESWRVWQWYDSQIFAANGPLAAGRVLLGLAVGVLAGLLTRRSLPSMGYGVLAMGGVLYALELLRPSLWPATTSTTTVEQGHPGHSGMTIDQGGLTSTGTRIPDPCLTDAGCTGVPDLAGYYRDYHPSSHFWPLHLVETGIVLAVTVLATAAAFWLLRRRTR